jgi:pantoate--beta-alanine ligase
VVLKLFQIALPDLAVFGEKDYQQLLVIRRMVADLLVPVRIVGEPTVREPDGLAMSSRNRYLDPDQRQAATVLYRALTAARRAVLDGETSANRVRQILAETIESQRMVRSEYAEIADADTLEHLDRIEPGTRAIALVAARVGATRLIDNLALTESSTHHAALHPEE